MTINKGVVTTPSPSYLENLSQVYFNKIFALILWGLIPPNGNLNFFFNSWKPIVGGG